MQLFKVKDKTLTNGTKAVKSTSDIVERKHRLMDTKIYKVMIQPITKAPPFGLNN